jgi:hypothetical protein
MENYKDEYHQMLLELATPWADGTTAAKIDQIYEMIAPYVELDATKFVTYEEFESAVPELQELITLRGQSILGQIAGTIPSTTEGQQADPSKLITSETLDMDSLGDMGGGMGGGFEPSEGGQMPEGFDPSQGGQMPEGFEPSEGGQIPEGFEPSQGGQAPGTTNNPKQNY